MSGLPPVPIEFQRYNSYVTDPIFARRFTYAYAAIIGFCTLYFVFPLVLSRAVRSGRFKEGWVIWERLGGYVGLSSNGKEDEVGKVSSMDEAWNGQRGGRLGGVGKAGVRIWSAWHTVCDLAIPLPFQLPFSPKDDGQGTISRRTYLPLTVGQFILAGAYTAAVGVCVFKDAELRTNTNRLGFLALAQLTPLLLLSTKSSPLALLLSTSWEKLNWAHRWSGRLVWLCATVHGFFWVDSMGWGAGMSDKMTRGLIAWSCLTAIALTSIGPVRKRLYNLFWVTHLLCFVGFFAAVAYHTTYSRPWIYPPVALYAWDCIVKLGRCRFADGLIVPLEGGVTLIHLPDLNAGFLPTQHVHIRILSSSIRTLESHPLTISSSPLSLSPLPVSSSSGSAADGGSQGITLLAFPAGRWSSAVHSLARSQTALEKVGEPMSVRVVLDGPYGGLWTGVGDKEVVVCLAGGSGVSFLLGVGEEVKRAQREGRGTQGRLTWILRDIETYHSLVPLFRPLLSPSITLSIVLSRPFSTPPTLGEHTTLLPLASASNLLQDALLNAEPTRGVQVLACGPEGLVKEVRMAVGALGVSERVEFGGVEFWGEGFGV